MMGRFQFQHVLSTVLNWSDHDILLYYFQHALAFHNIALSCFSLKKLTMITANDLVQLDIVFISLSKEYCPCFFPISISKQGALPMV